MKSGPGLTTASKFLGAGYLIYIGVKSIFAKASHIEIEETNKIKDISAFEAVKIGFLTNVLNPKATLFFLSLFTLVITPGTPAVVLGILGAIMIANTFLWFSLVALFMTQKMIRKIFNRFEGVFNKIFGSLLIGIGIKVALSEK